MYLDGISPVDSHAFMQVKIQCIYFLLGISIPSNGVRMGCGCNGWWSPRKLSPSATGARFGSAARFVRGEFGWAGPSRCQFWQEG